MTGQSKPNGSLARHVLAVFMPVFLVCCLVSGVFLGITLYDQRQQVFESMAQHELGLLDTERRVINEVFADVVTDLLFLVRSGPLRDAVAGEPGGIDRLDAQFRAFSGAKGRYQQVRYLAADGMEISRIDALRYGVVVVPRDQLQDKSERYYFINTMRLPPGWVYVSPMDLNVEHGMVEYPFLPVIRVSTRVFDAQAEPAGITILNLDARGFLEQLRLSGLQSRGDVMLLNDLGYWMLAPNPDDEWGFMFDDMSQKTFAARYPDVWAAMAEDGEVSLFTDQGLFTALALHPLPPPGDPYCDPDLPTCTSSPSQDTVQALTWYLVSRIPNEALAEQTNRILTAAVPTGLGLLALSTAFALASGLAVARKRQAREELLRLAQFDTLTGLPNRLLFFDRLGRALEQARRAEGSFALLYVDLDDFKAVNDTMGHDAGDALLVEAAGRMAQTVRKVDTVARLGGDEFAVVLQEVRDKASAGQVAAKLVETVGRPYDLERGRARVGVSVGVALYPEDAGDLNGLMRVADEAMYASKRGGKNTCTFASYEDDGEAPCKTMDEEAPGD